MDQYLRKYQWLLQFAVLAIASTLVAVIINRTLVAAQLAPLTVPKLPTHRQANGGGDGTETSSTLEPSRWDDALASRCYFGCAEQEEKKERECPGGCAEGKKCKKGVCVPVEEKKSQPEQPDVPVESDLNVKLEGCMVAADPKYSTAMVRDGETEETYVVSPGDYLPEDSEVIRIARDRIFIRRDGQLEFIRLEETIGGDPSPVSVSPTQRGGGGGANPAAAKAARTLKKAGGGGGELVRDQSGEEFELSEETVHKKLQDKKKLAQEVRTTANYEDGEKKGVKLVGVSPNSLYSDLGFQTGDVLHSVGGKKVNSGTDIQKLIDRLSQRDSVDVVVERNGQKEQRTYNIE